MESPRIADIVSPIGLVTLGRKVCRKVQVIGLHLKGDDGAPESYWVQPVGSLRPHDFWGVSASKLWFVGAQS